MKALMPGINIVTPNWQPITDRWGPAVLASRSGAPLTPRKESHFYPSPHSISNTELADVARLGTKEK